MNRLRRKATRFAPPLRFSSDLGLKGSALYAGPILMMGTLNG